MPTNILGRYSKVFKLLDTFSFDFYNYYLTFYLIFIRFCLFCTFIVMNSFILTFWFEPLRVSQTMLYPNF